MRKYLLLILIFAFVKSANAQLDLSGGMGINFVNASSLTDYINLNWAPIGDKLASFNSAVEFFVEGDMPVSENFNVGLEYAVSIHSYSTSSIAGVYDISYYHHKPSLMAYYVIHGTGYKFKFGGGLGIRFVNLEEKIIQTANITTTGWGALARVEGHTLLSGNVYANVGLDVRYDMPGELVDGNYKIFNNYLNENVTVDALSFGVKLGVSYYF
ncbi:MAG: hypothetical protein K9J16_03360 [Melioribacteraceae bacterium]|nr:hypothetical protein [Melioribacteraceae bacterium]MCF8355836.1 hypothetical protein [Melioribacteraceae bacterium]MCF8392589.1 hypothetical protein [Melioribacteraceae bacterium]MCF8418539.1 hypothetical protein [Melioribacteraceae bacterium]